MDILDPGYLQLTESFDILDIFYCNDRVYVQCALTYDVPVHRY